MLLIQKQNNVVTIKPVLSSHSTEDKNLVFKADYGLMQVKFIAECSFKEHSAILLTCIKLPSVFNTFVCQFLVTA